MQINPKKHLGQNFLTSKDIVKKIVKAAKINAKDKVIEIGPGLGILTLELVKNTESLTSIELDSEIITTLKENLKRDLKKEELERVKIINQNALSYFPDPKTFKNYKIVANIPYYITSPLITHFLTLKNPPTSLTLLVQKEVAEKICAQTKSNPREDHSVLSIMVQLYATPALKSTVHAGSFTPAPKVESAVIHLETHKKTGKLIEKYKNPEKIIQLAKRAFSGKRKMLSNTLKEYKDILIKLRLADKRPENLSLKDWEKLAKSTRA